MRFAKVFCFFYVSQLFGTEVVLWMKIISFRSHLDNSIRTHCCVKIIPHQPHQNPADFCKSLKIFYEFIWSQMTDTLQPCPFSSSGSDDMILVAGLLWQSITLENCELCHSGMHFTGRKIIIIPHNQTTRCLSLFDLIAAFPPRLTKPSSCGIRNHH